MFGDNYNITSVVNTNSIYRNIAWPSILLVFVDDLLSTGLFFLHFVRDVHEHLKELQRP